jgi:hypothetical protein
MMLPTPAHPRTAFEEEAHLREMGFWIPGKPIQAVSSKVELGLRLGNEHGGHSPAIASLLKDTISFLPRSTSMATRAI